MSEGSSPDSLAQARESLQKDIVLVRQSCWVLHHPGDARRLLLVARGRRLKEPIITSSGEGLLDTAIQAAIELPLEALMGPRGIDRRSPNDQIEVLLVCLFVRGHPGAPGSFEAWRTTVEAAGFQATPLVDGIKLHDTHDSPYEELIAERTAPERLVQLWRLGQLG